ncbi:MAG: C40 family peptidase [Tyzzerella sp.]|nr:C40 family peptidase [Tyzzerella sp.]
MKRFHRAFVTVLILISVFATSVLAAPSVNELERKKKNAEKAMKELQDDLAETMADINEMEMKLVSKGEEVIRATAQLEEAEINEQKQYDNMVKRIVAMYERGDSSALQVIFESGSVAKMLQNMNNVQSIHEYDRAQLDKYIQVKEEIATLKATLETEQKEMQSLQAQLERQQKSLNQKISAKKTEIKNFDRQIEDAVQEAARRAAEEKDKVVLNSGTGGVKYTGTGDPAVGKAIVAETRKYLGVPYAWGGNTMKGIDCSGLTKAAHAAVGIYIDRWSGHQAIGGKAIGSVAEARPGDIICYSGHVAIYIGNERVIHAPHTGSYVKEATVYLKEIIAIRRYW